MFQFEEFLKINDISRNRFGFIGDCFIPNAMHELIMEIVNTLNSYEKCIGVWGSAIYTDALLATAVFLDLPGYLIQYLMKCL